MPFLAWMFTVLPWLVAVMPSTLPDELVSLITLVRLWRRRICTPSFLALASSGRMSAVPLAPVGEMALTPAVQTGACDLFTVGGPPSASPGA